ncbi:helix-turn-helix transcriptional regulator [Pectinatus cerevisiiphilus]|uniref:Poly-beta-hydroxybutyrate-responsive repressor n=1 Tax=Pectinatus cerevisiiphilus TaxID=86956 RepID=A0A4R3K768_9FIRM|nr:helix-turn-helix transcriptional regulator [Pectinatus cerevisiiphilus]TCS78689.1 poly-beta-hydroxybutyrate-responsive repressor [Pectinatus cerevisiiphilus]
MNIGKVQQHRHLPAFILLELAHGNAHGGAIYNALINNIPDFQCDTAAIYRTLNQLNKDGAVTFSWDTSHAGPARKIYSITPIGYEQLTLWKSDIEQRIKKLQFFLHTYETTFEDKRAKKR